MNFYLGKMRDDLDTTYDPVKDKLVIVSDISELFNLKFLYDDLTYYQLYTLDIYQCQIGTICNRLFTIHSDYEGKNWTITCANNVSIQYHLDYHDLYEMKCLSEGYDIIPGHIKSINKSLYPIDMKDINVATIFSIDISPYPKYDIIIDHTLIHICLNCLWCNLLVGKCEKCSSKTMCAGAQYLYADE